MGVKQRWTGAFQCLVRIRGRNPIAGRQGTATSGTRERRVLGGQGAQRPHANLFGPKLGFLRFRGITHVGQTGFGDRLLARKAVVHGLDGDDPRFGSGERRVVPGRRGASTPRTPVSFAVDGAVSFLEGWASVSNSASLALPA